MAESVDEPVVWGYQHHFRVGAKSAARSVFELLDPSLLETAFLLCVPANSSIVFTADHVILDPRDVPCDRSDFLTIHEQAAAFLAGDGRAKEFHSHPLAQRRHGRFVESDSIRLAVERILRGTDDLRGLRSHVCFPGQVREFLVFVILQFHADSLRRYERLHVGTPHARWREHRSLVDEATQELWEVFLEELSKPEPGAGLSLLRYGPEAVLRKAGESFIERVSDFCNEVRNIGGLFRQLNRVSQLLHERRTVRGGILFARKGHPNVDIELRFERPISLDSVRAVRKVLEVTSDDLFLLSDSAEVYGLGRVLGGYDRTNEDLYKVDFVSTAYWRLLHDMEVLMEVRHGLPRLPRRLVDEDRLKDTIRRVFQRESSAAEKRINLLAETAARQTHGSLLVIAVNAHDEVERLQEEGIKLDPVVLAPEHLEGLSSIDGAIMIDPDGVCHGAGIILDGPAGKGGDPSRGSRYNSAVRYVRSNESRSMALVVSDDGGFDVIPDLMPRIPRGLIPQLLKDLQRVADSQELPVKEYYRAMSMLQRYAFYLTPEDCELANTLRGKIDARLKEEQERSTEFRIVYEDFVPRGEVDDSYFIDG